MPRYHFNLSDGCSDVDMEGYELADMRAAREASAQLLGRMLLDDPRKFWGDGEWVLTVASDSGLVLFTLHLIATDAPGVGVVSPNPLSAA